MFYTVDYLTQIVHLFFSFRNDSTVHIYTFSGHRLIGYQPKQVKCLQSYAALLCEKYFLNKNVTFVIFYEDEKNEILEFLLQTSYTKKYLALKVSFPFHIHFHILQCNIQIPSFKGMGKILTHAYIQHKTIW